MIVLQILSAAIIIAATNAASSGYGYWNVLFHDGVTLADSEGLICDSFNRCDPYMRIKIDGKEVWRGKTMWNSPRPRFNQRFKSPKIRKDSKVSIELWDNDSEGVIRSNDELMSQWGGETPVSMSKYKKLKGRDLGYTYFPNHVNMDSTWTDA